MADIYVRSTDGSDADNGSTWALAKASLVGAAGIDAAGDRVIMSDAHAGSYTALQTYAFAGTLASPVVVFGGDDASEPPTTYSSSWTETVTNNNGMLFSGAVAVFGGTFKVGTTGGSAAITVCNGTDVNQSQTFVGTTFANAASGAGSAINIGNTSSSMFQQAVWRDVTYYPTNQTSTGKAINVNMGRLVWDGGGLHASSSAITQLFLTVGSAGRAALVEASGLDVSVAASTLQLFPASGCGRAMIRNSKLPASWTGTLCGSGVTVPGYRCEMFNCDSGDTNYRIWIEDFAGSVKQDTAVYLDAGAYDGATRLSYRHTATANCNFLSGRFYGPELTAWNETTGSSVTATVEIVHDGAAALNDDEIWLEVMYLGTSGYPLGTWVSDAKADVLATAAAQTTSSEAWTGDSGTGPNGSTTWHTLKLSVSFTPQEKGVVIGRVVMGAASKTAYVDPNLTLS